jgi:hypothetical protein
MEYEQLLALIRDKSRQREERFRSRYGADASKPMLLAQRWRTALESEPLDWTDLSAIREDARLLKRDADVALFGFINELERSFTLLRRAEME